MIKMIKRYIFGALLAIAALNAPANAQQISAEDLKQGFIMNFYPILDTSRPNQPKGRPIASLVYNDGFPFSYYKPFDMRPALTKYKDNWWLIVLEGYLNLQDNGEYTFATTLLPGNSSYSSTCGSEISLNNVSISKLSHVDSRSSRNSYKDIPLAAGLYPIQIKYSCIAQNRRDVIPKFELSVRGPRDNILAPFAAKNVYHISR